MALRRVRHRLSQAWWQLAEYRQPKLQPIPKLFCWSNQLNLRQAQKLLEKILNENILPFWYPKIMDTEYGGYRLHHDVRGQWKGETNKRLVTQARTVWFFSRLANSQYGTSDCWQAAKHGYEFLRDRLWDSQWGGLYWEVDAIGHIATIPDKHLYGQAFALYALSEYAIASGDASATALAANLFDLIDDRAHDRNHGGYRECFCQDWQPATANQTNHIGGSTTIKQMNTHLHLLEAITTYYRLTQERRARERLIELILIQSNAVVRQRVGACTERYQLDWTPLHGLDGDRISYGHDLENIWLLIEACDAAGLPHSPLLEFYRTLFNYSLQYGYDRKQGGFYHRGYYNSPAHQREKIWWVQAEALVSALQLYRLTGEAVYCHCFCQTLDWIVNHQVDWEDGDWYAEVRRNGTRSGDKAGAWKSPYHNGRAMLQCLDLLASEVE